MRSNKHKPEYIIFCFVVKTFAFIIESCPSVYVTDDVILIHLRNNNSSVIITSPLHSHLSHALLTEISSPLNIIIIIIIIIIIVIINNNNNKKEKKKKKKKWISDHSTSVSFVFSDVSAVEAAVCGKPRLWMVAEASTHSLCASAAVDDGRNRRVGKKE
jgi:hypothetical protein